MLDGHSLGPARRARGVDHVGQVARDGERLGVRRVLSGDRRRRGVQRQHAPPGPRHQLAQRAVGHQDREAGVGGEKGEPLRGVDRIERHVGAAGLEDAEERRDHRRGPLVEQADAGFRPHPETPEVPGQLVRPRVELGVRRALRAGDDGGGRGRPRRLGGKELMQAEAVRPARREPCGGAQELRALRGGQEGELRDALLRRGGRGRQQAREMPHHALGRGGVEEVRVVEERRREVAGDLAQP